MKRFLIAGILVLAGAMIVASCKKGPEKEKGGVTIEVTNIASTSASVNVNFKGTKPTLVRLTKPVDAEIASLNITDETAVADYATKNGEAISLPYTTEVTGLEPGLNYVIAVMAMDANMKLINAKAVTFSTLDPDNAIGDPSGAGEITARTL